MHETVELVHARGASRLRVESTSRSSSIDDVELLRLLGTDGTCGPLTIHVDGRPVAFASACAGDTVVARWVGYEACVTVRAERWPMAFGLELERMGDLTAYHQGRLRLLPARGGFDLGR